MPEPLRSKDGRESSQAPRGPDADDYWGAFLFFAVSCSIFIIGGGKHVSEVLYVAMVLATVRERLRRSLRAKAAVVALFVSAALTLASPIDVDVRRSPIPGVRIVPVAYHLGASFQVRSFIASGRRENIDFIVIDRAPFLNHVRYSLVIFIPR